MTLPIAQLGQPVLRQVAVPVPPSDILMPEFQKFIEEMRATVEAEEGAGLAGPQVFSSRRVFLAAIEPPADEDAPLTYETFINPRITHASAETTSAWEGCLSFAELLVRVPRRDGIRVEYLNARAEPVVLELEGFAARVVQHEYDHLEGILTLDRAASTRDIIKASELKTVLAAEKTS